jgi:hypothetical protein
MRKTKIVMILGLVVCLTVVVYATRFGGFYGTDWPDSIPAVQAFLDEVDEHSGHTTTGPTAHYKSTWDTSNNSGVDDYEFTYSCGHGDRWELLTNNGWLDLNGSGFGGSSHQGWGDDRCNWILLYSCQVVAGPPDVTDWWSVWMSNNPYDVMDGVHMVLGFRTNAYKAPTEDVSSHYAEYICTGGKCLLKWFHAVWYYSYCQTTGYDKACAVFSPYSQNDTLTSYSSDPAPWVLYCWYYE